MRPSAEATANQVIYGIGGPAQHGEAARGLENDQFDFGEVVDIVLAQLAHEVFLGEVLAPQCRAEDPAVSEQHPRRSLDPGLEPGGAGPGERDQVVSQEQGHQRGESLHIRW